MKILTLIFTMIIASVAQAKQADLSGEYNLISSVCSHSVFSPFESQTVKPEDEISILVKKTGQDVNEYTVDYEVVVKNAKRGSKITGRMRTWNVGAANVLSATFSLSPAPYTITTSGKLLTIIEPVINSGDACDKGDISIGVYQKKKILGLF